MGEDGRSGLLRLVVVASVIVAAGACGGTSTDNAAPAGTVPASSLPKSATANVPSSWADVFALVPKARDTPGMAAVDVAGVVQRLGIDPTVAGPQQLQALSTVGAAAIPRAWKYTEQPALLRSLFFRSTRAIEAESAPEYLAVLVGDYDVAELSGEVETAVTAVRQEQPQRIEYGGRTYLKWPGKDMSLKRWPANTPRVDDLNRPMRISISKDLVIISDSEDRLKATIDTINQRSNALADDKTLLSAAGELDRVRARVFVTATGRDSGHDYIVSMGGTAWGDGGDAKAVFVAADTSPEAATKDVEHIRSTVASGSSSRSREPWSRTLSIDSVDAKGPMVTAAFTTQHPAALMEAVLVREPLTSPA